MRLLLGSGGFRTPERVEFLRQQMHAFFGSIREIVFIPFALRDHDGYLETMRNRELGYDLVGLHAVRDPHEAIRRAEGLFVGGGNTFRLLDEMYRRDLLSVIRERVRAGMPYLGVSAGSNLACPTIKTTNDMPITQPPSLDALALVPFQINAHYFEGQPHVLHDGVMIPHLGETRDERLREFHEMNATPVVGLWEAGTLWCESGRVLLAGAGARIFRQGQEAFDVAPVQDLAPALRIQPEFAYTVTIQFQDAALADEWIVWMRIKHLHDVVSAGAKAAELIELDSDQGRTFEARYRFGSRQAFSAYERDHAPRLRAEGLALFPLEKGITYRRTMGTMVN